jgi:CheY-like chemotaxis protein
MKTVMIIDDSKLMRQVIRQHVEAEGYCAITVASGMDALSTLETVRPDMVMLDLLMPGMSGQDVLRALRPRLPGIPMIVITADVQEPVHEECTRLGADRVINKPPSREAIRGVLRLIPTGTPSRVS